MSDRNPQTQYPSTKPNDILTECIDAFEKKFRERRIAVSGTESTNVQAAINRILTATYK